MFKRRFCMLYLGLVLIFYLCSCVRSDEESDSVAEKSDVLCVENVESAVNSQISDVAEEISEAESKIPTEYISVDALDFTGEWHRTNTVMRLFANIVITNQTNESFDFVFEGYDTVSGYMKGTAKFVSDRMAIYEVEDEWTKEYYTKVAFIILEESLCVEVYRDDKITQIQAYGPHIKGEYTKETPYYTNANLINEIFTTEEMKEKVKTLLGDKSYKYMTEIFDFGTQYEEEVLTYSGFIDHVGMGVDILLREDKIYCLLYIVYDGGYTFYTNDSAYQTSMPESFKIERADYNLKFVYKDV